MTLRAKKKSTDGWKPVAMGVYQRQRPDGAVEEWIRMEEIPEVHRKRLEEEEAASPPACTIEIGSLTECVPFSGQDQDPPWYATADGVTWYARATDKTAQEPTLDDGSNAGLVVDESTREALFNGRKIKINSGADFVILLALLKADGGVVSHAKLLRALKPSTLEEVGASKDAPQEVKDAVTRTRKALKAVKAPHRITNSKGIGYKLSRPHE